MHAGKGFIVPPCPNCGGILKPDVVFFGDGVPAERSKRCVPLLRRHPATLLQHICCAVAGVMLTCMPGTPWLLQGFQSRRLLSAQLLNMCSKRLGTLIWSTSGSGLCS